MKNFKEIGAGELIVIMIIKLLVLAIRDYTYI